MSFVIDETGITTPSASEVRDLIVDFWRETFGAGAQTASETGDGMIIDILAITQTLVWGGVVQTYNDGFFRTSELDQLLLILDPFGIKQIPAAPSSAAVVLIGTDATAVPAATTIRVGDDGALFETDAAYTIDAATLIDVIYVDDLPAAGPLNLSVDYGPGFVIGASVVSTGVETATALATDLAADLNNAGSFQQRGIAYVSGTDASGRARIVIVSTIVKPTITLGPPTFPGALAVNTILATAAATENGAIPAPAGELDQIVTPVSGLDDAVNFSDETTGRLDETASEIRQRHLETLNSGGCASPPNIRAGLLANVLTVLEAFVDENETSTDFTGSGGLPPHSFEPIILSSPVGGPFTDDQAIAEEIYRCKPGGIQSYGSTTVQVEGAAGTVDIGFTRSTVNDLWLEVTVTKGEGFPDVGDPAAALVSAIAEYYQTGAGVLGQGSDFENQTVNAPVLSTYPQVKGVSVLSIGTTIGGVPGIGGEPALDAADIIVDARTILRVAKDRITVTLA